MLSSSSAIHSKLPMASAAFTIYGAKDGPDGMANLGNCAEVMSSESEMTAHWGNNWMRERTKNVVWTVWKWEGAKGR